jgi:phage N-6-adenine-methyltransferase
MAQHEKRGGSDEWYTPQYVFEALKCRFDMDVAAPADLTHVCVPADQYIKSESLTKLWRGFVWMNPPYGHNKSKSLWLNKLAKHGDGIALMPDRTSAPWWQEAANKADAILFVDGKIKFILPNGARGEQPGNGTTLFAYGQKAVSALLTGEQNGLGKTFKKYAITP